MRAQGWQRGEDRPAAERAGQALGAGRQCRRPAGTVEAQAAAAARRRRRAGFGGGIAWRPHVYGWHPPSAHSWMTTENSTSSLTRYRSGRTAPGCAPATTRCDSWLARSTPRSWKAHLLIAVQKASLETRPRLRGAGNEACGREVGRWVRKHHRDANAPRTSRGGAEEGASTSSRVGNAAAAAGGHAGMSQTARQHAAAQPCCAGLCPPARPMSEAPSTSPTPALQATLHTSYSLRQRCCRKQAHLPTLAPPPSWRTSREAQPGPLTLGSRGW